MTKTANEYENLRYMKCPSFFIRVFIRISSAAFSSRQKRKTFFKDKESKRRETYRWVSPSDRFLLFELESKWRDVILHGGRLSRGYFSEVKTQTTVITFLRFTRTYEQTVTTFASKQKRDDRLLFFKAVSFFYGQESPFILPTATGPDRQPLTTVN